MLGAPSYNNHPYARLLQMQASGMGSPMQGVPFGSLAPHMAGPQQSNVQFPTRQPMPMIRPPERPQQQPDLQQILQLMQNQMVQRGLKNSFGGGGQGDGPTDIRPAAMQEPTGLLSTTLRLFQPGA